MLNFIIAGCPVAYLY